MRRAWIVATICVGAAVLTASALSYLHFAPEVTAAPNTGQTGVAPATLPAGDTNGGRVPAAPLPEPTTPGLEVTAPSHHAEAANVAAPSEMGEASWSDFDGADTAGGEPMAGEALTASHPTLPPGTRVLVENVENGQTVVVRIDGRGPFTAGRIIDVSKAAAERLDMIKDGVATVRVWRVAGPVIGAHRSADYF